MALVDERGRVFGRFNLLDVALAVLLLGLVPLAYAGYALFRAPAPTLTAVEPMQVQHDEMMRAKIIGTNLRPYMRISLDNNQTREFLFKDSTTAEVTFTDVAPGTYDVVLYDYSQERARLPKGITIIPPALPITQVHVAGFLTGVTDEVMKELKPGFRFYGFAEILAVGDVSQDSARVMTGDKTVEIPVTGTKKVALLLKVPCTVRPTDTGVANCRAGSPNGPGIFLGPAITPGVYMRLPVLQLHLQFLVTQVRPAVDPTPIEITVKVPISEDAGELARVGERDTGYAANQFAANAVITRALHGDREITMTMPAYPTVQGYQYEGQMLRVGAPLLFITPRYQMSATITAMPPLPSQPQQ